MTIRHVVMFRFADDASDEQRRALARGLDGMPAATGAVRADDYRTYRDHPDHRALIHDLVEPIVTERASVQYEL